MGNFYEDLDLKPPTDEELGFMNRQRVAGYFSTIFIATIVALIASVIANFITIMNIVEAIAYFVAGNAMINIGVSEKKHVGLYATAGTGQILVGVLALLTLYMDTIGIQTPAGAVIAIILAIITGVVYLVGAFCEGKAYAKTIAALDWTLAEKWNVYAVLYIVANVGFIVCIILSVSGVLASAGIMLWVDIGLIILLFVVTTMKPVYLSKTIKCLEKSMSVVTNNEQ